MEFIFTKGCRLDDDDDAVNETCSSPLRCRITSSGGEPFKRVVDEEVESNLGSNPSNPSVLSLFPRKEVFITELEEREEDGKGDDAD